MAAMQSGKADEQGDEDGAQPPPPPPPPPIAATASSRTRTEDVRSDVSSFRDLMVPAPLLHALGAAGFERPSPVQKAAIPLGRTGADLIVQAKSGTGKTVVFAVICLERVKADATTTQALVLAPTREIAIQIEEVIRKLAAELPPPAATSAVFIGGLPVIDDEKRLRRLCHIAVGTPGRVSALIQSGKLLTEALTMFVLDEADALLADSFYSDTTWIYDQLPKRKQVIALSATYTPELLADLEPLMKRPQRVMTCTETVSLIGVRQFYALLQPDQPDQAQQGPAAAGGGGAGGQDEGAGSSSSGGGHATTSAALFRRKAALLLRLLSSTSFHQAAVFCNNKPRAEWLAQQLSSGGFPCAYLSGDRAQPERMEAMEAVKGFKLRVVVSTDVMARGVDLERVNLVVNVDLPLEPATYWHRVGRTGRFGSRGICVSYVTPPELATLREYASQEGRTLAQAAHSQGEQQQQQQDGSAAAAAVGAAGPHSDAAGGEAGDATAAAGPLLPLPEVIPEDLYSYELASDWEREALEQLQRSQQQQRAQAGLGGGGGEGGGLAPGPEGTAARVGQDPGSGATAAVAGEAAAALELPPLPEEVQAEERAAKKRAKADKKSAAAAVAAAGAEGAGGAQPSHTAPYDYYSSGYGHYGNGYGYYGNGYGHGAGGAGEASPSGHPYPYPYASSSNGQQQPYANGYGYGSDAAAANTTSSYGGYAGYGSPYAEYYAQQQQPHNSSNGHSGYDAWGRHASSYGSSHAYGSYGSYGQPNGYPDPYWSNYAQYSGYGPGAQQHDVSSTAQPAASSAAAAGKGGATGAAGAAAAAVAAAAPPRQAASKEEVARQAQAAATTRRHHQAALGPVGEEEEEDGDELLSFKALRGHSVQPASACSTAQPPPGVVAGPTPATAAGAPAHSTPTAVVKLDSDGMLEAGSSAADDDGYGASVCGEEEEEEEEEEAGDDGSGEDVADLEVDDGDWDPHAASVLDRLAVRAPTPTPTAPPNERLPEQPRGPSAASGTTAPTQQQQQQQQASQAAAGAGDASPAAAAAGPPPPPPPPPHLHGGGAWWGGAFSSGAQAGPASGTYDHPYGAYSSYGQYGGWGGGAANIDPQAYGAGYGYSQYSHPRDPYGSYNTHASAGPGYGSPYASPSWDGHAHAHAQDCPRCMRRMLRDFLTRYSAWQQQYDTWYREYYAWYCKGRSL